MLTSSSNKFHTYRSARPTSYLDKEDDSPTPFLENDEAFYFMKGVVSSFGYSMDNHIGIETSFGCYFYSDTKVYRVQGFLVGRW